MFLSEFSLSVFAAQLWQWPLVESGDLLDDLLRLCFPSYSQQPAGRLWGERVEEEGEENCERKI